jgi:hypothetical protein
MNNKQAEDFLVQQAAEQASLEAVPLSDLEKRMMYFTESDASSCEYPIELNDEFEAQYDAVGTKLRFQAFSITPISG